MTTLLHVITGFVVTAATCFVIIVPFLAADAWFMKACNFSAKQVHHAKRTKFEEETR